MLDMLEQPLPSRHAIPHPTGGRTELFLVRHGRTLGNVQRVLVGSTDIPMDELGIQQADLVAQRLAGAVAADVLVSSPLQRALVTAQAIGARMNLDPVVRPALAEWNFGEAEGSTFDVLISRYPEIAARFADIDDFEVGWPGGETRRQFHDRVYAEFMDLLASYERHSLIVVAHGGVFGSLLAQVQGISPNDWAQYTIHNCSVTHLEVSVGETAIHLLNDIEHLNGLTDSLERLQEE